MSHQENQGMQLTRPRVPAQDQTSTPVFDAIISTPLPASRIGIQCNQQGITGIQFLSIQTSCQQPSPDHPYQDLIDQLIKALQHYFDQPASVFSLPLAATGTAFQHRVWHAISTIASGETRSYGQLAHQLSTSPRAIGGACRANPLPLLVPCHRVIAADGRQGGFLGRPAVQGTAARLKLWLLQHESGITCGHHAHPH
jgi:methylated-DNA-[protein]-cysteine S-methyltransferase